jgi:hypothetical protein
MTDNEKRIAIAEACHWQTTDVDGIVCCLIDTEQARLETDVLNDLNAMHEAFKALPTYRKIMFHNRLLQLIKNPPDDAGEDFDYKVSNATAAQRADAFLMTLEKLSAG